MSLAQFAITPSRELWDAFIAAQSSAHFLQLWGWGEQKAAYGWQVERLALTKNDQIVAGAQILFRALPFRMGAMAYLAMGPLPADFDAMSENAELWRAIHAAARKHHAAFLKWEPGVCPGEKASVCTNLGFRPSPQTIQPPRTIIIDIASDDDAILARMNQGTRRKIRQSQKNGIRYAQASKAEVRKFTDMMAVTGVRNEFGVHEPAYYELAYELFVPDHGALFLAEHEGDVLAGIFVFAVGDTAWYVYGASSNLKRNLMASYGVQWAAIQWARARGCKHYDMWGIPDEDEAMLEAQFEQRSNGLWGVYGFKRGWGGAVVRSLGAWDYVYNPLIYKLYDVALRVRA